MASKEQGHLHPITQVIFDVYRIFHEHGFGVARGPELETPYYNFDALNIPKDHPARDLQDTFWLGPEKLLRTHTSSVQMHFMEKHKPPFRIIAPGKVFRQEASDRTHEAQFHQVEGLVVSKDASLPQLIGTLEYFMRVFFDTDITLRLRPSYFSFVEPGVEIDVSRDGGPWIEVLGAGMVHPQVLKNAGIDPGTWRGFAFGVGIDRLTMLKYGVDDIRAFYNGDLRLVTQF